MAGFDLSQPGALQPCVVEFSRPSGTHGRMSGYLQAGEDGSLSFVTQHSLEWMATWEKLMHPGGENGDK